MSAENKRLDKEMLETILSITTRCNYPQDLQIYFIVLELTTRGYVTETSKITDIQDRYAKRFRYMKKYKRAKEYKKMEKSFRDKGRYSEYRQMKAMDDRD